MRVATARISVFCVGLVSIGAASAVAGAAFTYDALGRIVSVRYDDGKQIVYTYDPAGNRTQEVVSATTVNRAPLAVTDALTLTEDQTSLTFNPRANDSDPDGNPLTLFNVTPGDLGTASITGGGTTVTYTTSHKRNAIDTFVYTLTDGQGMNSSGDVAVTLANLPPTANADSVSGQNPFFPTLDPRTNDTDPGNDPLTITQVTAPAHGTATIHPGGIQYTPAAGYIGPDSFTYTISDGDGGSATATVNTTTFANPPPVAVNDSVSGPGSTFPSFDPRSNDSDPLGDLLQVISTSLPSHGTVTILPDGGIWYSPTGGYTGFDTFTYTISDGGGNTATATVNVTVTN